MFVSPHVCQPARLSAQRLRVQLLIKTKHLLHIGLNSQADLGSHGFEEMFWNVKAADWLLLFLHHNEDLADHPTMDVKAALVPLLFLHLGYSEVELHYFTNTTLWPDNIRFQ